MITAHFIFLLSSNFDFLCCPLKLVIYHYRATKNGGNLPSSRCCDFRSKQGVDRYQYSSIMILLNDRVRLLNIPQWQVKYGG